MNNKATKDKKETDKEIEAKNALIKEEQELAKAAIEADRIRLEAEKKKFEEEKAAQDQSQVIKDAVDKALAEAAKNTLVGDGRKPGDPVPPREIKEPPSEAEMKKIIKVRAKENGYFNKSRVRTGDVFFIYPKVNDCVAYVDIAQKRKRETFLTAEEQFSDYWMERVEDLKDNQTTRDQIESLRDEESEKVADSKAAGASNKPAPGTNNGESVLT